MGKSTHQVKVGEIAIGGGAPISVQSMTSVYTYDIDASIKQINQLATAGADIVRVAVPHKKDTEALPEILSQVSVPIVADVHYHFDRALEAIDAGVHKIRLNPGNIKDRAQVKRVIDACKDAGIPIRVGVNEGSIVERSNEEQRTVDQSKGLVPLIVEKMEDYIRIFDECDFHDVVLSAKSINARLCIEAYSAISRRFDFPLHLGVTHAGPPETGTIRSAVALGTLLAQDIGDTIRVSFAADPVTEVDAGQEILYSLGLKQRIDPELIACPTCGRIEVDLIKLVADIREKLKGVIKPVKVAIMGCVVNGPGEAEGADVAIFAGRGRGIIYVNGKQTRTVNEDEMLDALLEEVENYPIDQISDTTVNIIPPDPLSFESRTGEVPADRLAGS